MNRYGLDIWGDNNFCINEDGKLCVNYKSKPSLQEIVSNIRSQQIKGPILLRFPHIIDKQIKKLYSHFNRAKKEIDYQGKFNAVFPLKVNHLPELVLNLVKAGKPYGYGLEAGSKAELILALAYSNDNAPITINGFKDEELIDVAFIARAAGHNVTVTIESLNELENIIKIANVRPNYIPNIGIRIKLHSMGSGIWEKSGGINSKFGLTSTELMEAVYMLKSNNLIDKFTMIHFHIGSQIKDIVHIKKALREAGNIYAELRKMGAKNLTALNLGGGLAVEYSQNKNLLQRHYSLREYANDVTFLLKSIANQKKEIEPDIFVESGRYISASHAVLIAPVMELFSQEYTEKRIIKKKNNPPLIAELFELYKSINSDNALEFLHDSIDHMESLLTLFDLGYIDLKDRSNTEVLVNLIIKKAVKLLNEENLLDIHDRVQEKYLVNFSIFQSLPDFWGLKQKFPVMPICHLNEKPTRSASIWDITCDSDGEVDFDKQNPLFLHEIDPFKEEYFLAFFLIGAYQEVLGMKHNLFTRPTEATVQINEKGYELSSLLETQCILSLFDDLNYDINDIKQALKTKISNSPLLNDKERSKLIEDLKVYLNDNSYLRSIHLQGKTL